MTHVSLFTGIGGLDLAAEAAGFETVLQVEREPYALKILERHWPNVPRITDVREVTSESVSGHVTVVSGGFPCQPFSAAGKRRGADDDRYLWPELLRIVEELQPSWVVGENVSGLLSIRDGMEIDDMLASLEARNYTPWILHYPAAGVGAHHKRDRVFIVAHSRELERIAGTEIEGVLRTLSKNGAVNNHADRSGATHTSNVATPTQQLRNGGGGARHRRDEHSDGGEDVAGANEPRMGGWQKTRDPTGEREGRDEHTKRRGDDAGPTWPTQPRMGGMAHGLPDWVDGEPAGIPRVATGVKDRNPRLTALGNAVVPAQAYPIFAAIAEAERANP